MTGPIVHISDSAPLKQEVAKVTQKQQVTQTNLNPTPALEQQVQPKPYGQDGVEFSKSNPVNYNPFATILQSARVNKLEEKPKKRWADPVSEDDEDEELPQNVHQSKSKKKSFWEDLFGDDSV